MSGLSTAQINQFERDGFLVVEDVLSQTDLLDPLRLEYAELLTSLCENWVEQGLLDAQVPNRSFEQQIISVYGAGLDYCQPLDISLPPGKIDANLPFHAGASIFNVMRAPRLLDCVESLIGAELTSNPIQHVRIKPPQRMVNDTEVRSFVTSTEWHQDRATTLEEADATQMITAWVAITDATAQNGCLQAVPGSHRDDMQHHCPLPQLGIPDSLMQGKAAQPLPVSSGGVVLFHPLTIHGSLSNCTEQIRWSFDLRYNVTGQPTGRPMFPSFVARSASQPDTELRSARAWKQLWLDARERLSVEESVAIHRWSADAQICA